MKEQYLRVIPLVLVVWLLSKAELHGQDIHYTQYTNGSALLNPALTGIFQGDSRLYLHYRNQWSKVDAYDATITGFYDTKLNVKGLNNGFLSAGIKFSYDRAGFSRLTLFNPALSVSYSHILGERWLGTLGFDLGYLARTFNTDDLQFGDQFNGDVFDPNSSEVIEDMSAGMIDLSAGVNLRYEAPNERSAVNFGGGVFHLNQPEQEFLVGINDENNDYPARLSAYVDANIKLSESIDLVTSLNFQAQQEYNENLGGLALKFYGDNSVQNPWALTLGGYGRIANLDNSNNDAVAPYLRFDYRKISVGVSYDVNISEFADFTNNQGGLEIWAQFRFDKFKKIGDFKTCRIF